jgi:hypothetical protein
MMVSLVHGLLRAGPTVAGYLPYGGRNGRRPPRLPGECSAGYRTAASYPGNTMRLLGGRGRPASGVIVVRPLSDPATGAYPCGGANGRPAR